MRTLAWECVMCKSASPVAFEYNQDTQTSSFHSCRPIPTALQSLAVFLTRWTALSVSGRQASQRRSADFVTGYAAKIYEAREVTSAIRPL